MHNLHKILVYIPDVVTDAKSLKRDSLIDAIRSYAEDETEDFFIRVFDWRETKSAGRWSNAYPENVLLGCEDPAAFYKELEQCYQAQKAEMDELVTILKESVGTDIEHIAHGMWKQNNDDAPEGGFDLWTGFYLNRLAMLLNGDYFFNSMFYNVRDNTARIYKNTFAAVQESPDEWALALFDYHY